MYTNLSAFTSKFFNKIKFKYNNSIYTLHLNADYTYTLKLNKKLFKNKFKLTMLRTDTFLADCEGFLKLFVDLKNKRILFLNYSENNVFPIMSYKNE